MKHNKISSFFALSNLLLTIIGYEFLAIVFLPAATPEMEGVDNAVLTQIYTIPFRALCLLVSLLTMLLNIREKIQWTGKLKLLFFLIFLWIFRLVYDFYIRTDIDSGDNTKTQIFVAMAILSLYSILKSYRRINFDLAYKYFCISLLVIIVAFAIKNPNLFASSADLTNRMDASIGLSTLGLAAIGCFSMLMLICWRRQYALRGFFKLAWYLAFFLSLLISLRSGSRGPLVAFMMVLMIYVFGRIKDKTVGLAVCGILVLFFYIFSDLFIDLVGEISPVLKDRLTEKDEVNVVARQAMYKDAINGFMSNPLFGDCFGVRINGTKSVFYPHNTILEAFNGLGLLGGLIYIYLINIAFVYTYRIVHSKIINEWMGLLLIFRIICSFFSGNFYSDGALISIWGIILVMYESNRRNIKFNDKKIVLKN